MILFFPLTGHLTLAGFFICKINNFFLHIIFPIYFFYAIRPLF